MHCGVISTDQPFSSPQSSSQLISAVLHARKLLLSAHRSLRRRCIYTGKASTKYFPETKPMQQSCSHYNTFCSTTHTSKQPLQCDLHPHGAEHQGRTDYASKRAHPQPPRTQGRLPPLHTEKQKVSCSGSSPKQSPCNNHAAVAMRFAAPPRCHTPFVTTSIRHYNAFCSITWHFPIFPCYVM